MHVQVNERLMYYVQEVGDAAQEPTYFICTRISFSSRGCSSRDRERPERVLDVDRLEQAEQK